MEFTKLSNLINEDVMVTAVRGFTWKLWDPFNNKMLSSIVYEKGYRKLYQVQTDKGQLDLGTGQIGSLLEAVFHEGKADLIGRTFNVKSNGKSGMDVRYFFNAQPVVTQSQVNQEEDGSEPWL